MFAPRYYVRKDGSRFPVSFTKTPVMLGGEVIGTIEIFRDATKGVEMDRTKSEFVSLAAHQLRTPLSIIAMHAELLKKQGQLFGNHDEKMCVDYATEIHDVAMRMADLINDLLNVSRIDTQTLVVTPGPVDVRKLVDGILRDGVDEGVFRTADPKMSALQIFGMCNYAWTWYQPDGARSVEDIARLFARNILDGLAGAPADDALDDLITQAIDTVRRAPGRMPAGA